MMKERPSCLMVPIVVALVVAACGSPARPRLITTSTAVTPAGNLVTDRAVEDLADLVASGAAYDAPKVPRLRLPFVVDLESPYSAREAACPA